MLASDAVTTVSPTYAGEIHSALFAHGLEGTVGRVSHKLQGILNGIDTVRCDPARDPLLAAPFSAGDRSGRAACKADLQRRTGLHPDPAAPVVGCVSRLVRHKGFDLVAEVLEQLMDTGLQMVVLGSGDSYFEDIFRAAAGRWPGRFAAHIGYSDELASAIYGGADLFLMPSLSEPCGLSQMIAMRYGALPVVRETGGLKDTVTAYRPDTGEGNGFTFASVSAHDMAWVVREAVGLYRSNPEAWSALQLRAMTGDYSWDKSAGAYEDIYRRLAEQ
ncbi:Glycogen synthase [bioreactor metagenome]|uniref:Glycogen synthase n=1 Tax=bioreactor metagenome TaxID=1076179 RepID=A0A644ZYK2_9ZZZZ